MSCFPRSATHDPAVHGTFRSVIERLPDIRAMGFDVLYFPPINPIGRINRKGRNNSLRAEPGDVGSPYAIGSAEGGHDATHPALARWTISVPCLMRRARHDLEIAHRFCDPVRAGSSMGLAAQGLVPLAARRVDALRRKSAEEI